MTRDVAEDMMLMADDVAEFARLMADEQEEYERMSDADCNGCDLYAGECDGADLYIARDETETWFDTMAEVEAAVKRVDERYEAVCSIGEYLDTYFGVEFRHTGDTW